MLRPDPVAALVPTLPTPGRVQPAEPLFTPAFVNVPVGTMAVFTPPIVEVPPPNTCDVSETVRGKPLNQVTIPDVFQPWMNLSKKFPVLSLWPFPNGSS